MTKVLLKTENLSTGYSGKRGRYTVLHKDLSLELHSGEMVCVLGPNGTGKSTLLRTLLGFQEAQSGRVFYGKRSLHELAVTDLAREVAVVLTDRIDDDFLTAYEVVATGRYPYTSFSGKLSEDDHRIVEEAIRLVGRQDKASQRFVTLSDGEKQKVMIARAIAQQTPLVFLDEPAAFIDSPSKVMVMELLKKLCREQNKGLLLTTHDMEPALRFADRIWLLGDEGRFEEGTPDELVNNGSINRFFDNPSVVFNKENKRFEKRGSV